MNETGSVRTLGADTALPASRSVPMLPALAVAVSILVALLVAGGSGEPPTGLEGITFRDAALASAPTAEEQALEVVHELAEAFERGDGAAAAALLADDWVWLDVPGTIQNPISPGAIADATSRFRFATAISDIELGPCSTRPTRPEALGDFAVVCPEATAVGAYADAIGRSGTNRPLMFAIAGDHIVSLAWGGQNHDRYASTAYCEFALSTGPTAAAAFDGECRPIETAETLSLHQRLAALYVAVERPAPDRSDIDTRYARPTVEALMRASEEGSALAVSDYVSTRTPLAAFPGLLHDPAAPRVPPATEFFAWSGQVFDVTLGECSVSPWNRRDRRVDCPHAAWSGPLVTALDLGPVHQPVSFLVSNFRITNATGETAPELAAAFAGFCTWLRTEHPVQAEWAFEEGCAPDLSATGATALLDGAARYASDHG